VVQTVRKTAVPGRIELRVRRCCRVD